MLLEQLQTIRIYEEDIMSVAHKIEQQGLQRGLQQGRYEEDLKIAKRMLARGTDRGYIKDVIGLSDQDLLNLED